MDKVTSRCYLVTNNNYNVGTQTPFFCSCTFCSCLIYGEATAQQMVPSEWLDKMRNLVFLFNSAKRYHEEYEGFDEEYESGLDV